MSRQDQLTLSTKIGGRGELRGDDILLHVDMHVRLNEVADVEAEHLALDARKTPIARELRQLAHKIYKQRRLRDKLVGEKLFGEPAWDMLLALYCLPRARRNSGRIESDLCGRVGQRDRGPLAKTSIGHGPDGNRSRGRGGAQEAGAADAIRPGIDGKNSGAPVLFQRPRSACTPGNRHE